MSGLVAAPLLRERLRDRAAQRQDLRRDLRRPLLHRGHAPRHAGAGRDQRRARSNRARAGACRSSRPTIRTTSSRRTRAAHDVLLCIGTGKTVSDTNRMRFYSDQFYLKSRREMRELWSDLPEACDNTVRDRGASRHPHPGEDLPPAAVSRAASAGRAGEERRGVSARDLRGRAARALRRRARRRRPRAARRGSSTSST